MERFCFVLSHHDGVLGATLEFKFVGWGSSAADEVNRKSLRSWSSEGEGSDASRAEEDIASWGSAGKTVDDHAIVVDVITKVNIGECGGLSKHHAETLGNIRISLDAVEG